MTEYAQKENYPDYEIDFGRRLVAKFRFDPETFWRKDRFPKVQERELYPSARSDPLFILMLRVAHEIKN
jgi:hypothetical protein